MPFPYPTQVRLLDMSRLQLEAAICLPLRFSYIFFLRFRFRCYQSGFTLGVVIIVVIVLQRGVISGTGADMESSSILCCIGGFVSSRLYTPLRTRTRVSFIFFLGYNMLDSACNRPKISFGWIARYTMLCCTETPSTTRLEITTPRSGSQLRSDPDFWVQRRLTLTVGNIFWVGCRRPKLQTVCISCYERGGGVVV